MSNKTNKTDKSIIVIDTPESCDKCPLFHGFYSDMTCGGNHRSINYPYPENFRQKWCPLSTFPPYKDLSQYNQCGDSKSALDMMLSMRDSGYNDCLDDIMEKVNEK